MKRFSLLHSMKSSMIFSLMLALTFSLASCGSDEPDTPNPPIDDSQIAHTNLKASELPGIWLIESFTDENGKVEKINDTVTILPFSVKQTTDPVESDQNYWAETYSSLLEYETIDGTKSETLIIGFQNKKGASLSNSLVYEFSLTYENFDLTDTLIFVLCDLSYENGVLTATKSSYNTVHSAGTRIPRLGTVRMKKIK